ncbi:kinase, putative [Plasmodium relictum]|uniref:Kinase n=1 Tax=Plasmodium relictum TaxID=85471 RepID=A0A1J1H7J3_PLARL|nr:kinase, putative [Plasmodium relictum]CRH00517.1 kinase, putative [Plasmodium relictum]
MDEKVCISREGEIYKTCISDNYTYINNNNVNKNSKSYNMKNINISNQKKEKVSFNLNNTESIDKNECELINKRKNAVNNKLKIDIDIDIDIDMDTYANRFMNKKKRENVNIEEMNSNREKDVFTTDNDKTYEKNKSSEDDYIVANESDHNSIKNNNILNGNNNNDNINVLNDSILYNSINNDINKTENYVSRNNMMINNIKDMKMKMLQNYLIENDIIKNRTNIYDSYNFNYNSFKLMNEDSSSDDSNYERFDNENNFIENFNFLNISKVNIDKAYEIINMYLPCIDKNRKGKKKKNRNIYTNHDEILYSMSNLKLTGTSIILTNENSKFIYKVIPFFKNGEANFYINAFTSFNYIYKNHKKIKDNDNAYMNSEKGKQKNNLSFYNKIHEVCDNFQKISQNIIKKNSNILDYYKGVKHLNNSALSSSDLVSYDGIITSDDTAENMVEENNYNIKSHSLDNLSDHNSNYKEKDSLNSYFSKKLTSDFFRLENILKKGSNFYNTFEYAKTSIKSKLVNKKNSLYSEHIEINDHKIMKKQNSELNNKEQEIVKLNCNKNLNDEINENINVNSKENSCESINSNFVYNEINYKNFVKNIANENDKIFDVNLFKESNKKIDNLYQKDINLEKKKNNQHNSYRENFCEYKEYLHVDNKLSKIIENDNILNEKYILSFLVKHKLIPKCYDIVPVYKCTKSEKEEKKKVEISKSTFKENIKRILGNNENNKELNHYEKFYDTNLDNKKNKINDEKNLSEGIKSENKNILNKESLNQDLNNENNINEKQDSKFFGNETKLNENHKNKCKSEKESKNKGEEQWKVGNYSNLVNENIDNVHLALKLKKVCNKVRYFDQHILDLKLGYNTLKDNDLSFNEELLKASELLDWNEKEKYVKKWSKMKKKIRNFYTNTSDQHIIHISSKDLDLPSYFDKYDSNEIYCILKSWKQNVTSLKTTQKTLGFRICSLIYYMNYENILEDENVKRFYSDFILKKNIIERNERCETEKLKTYAEKKKLEIKECYEDINKRLKINRKLGLKLSEEQVLYFLTIFLKNVVYIILPKLLNLKLWLEEQSLYYFCSTSLLIIYDKKKPFSCDIKWIDFTYSFENLNYLKKRKKERINLDILFGLNNLIKLCKTIFFNNNLPPSISYFTNQENKQEYNI